jgi:hypothetical protein
MRGKRQKGPVQLPAGPLVAKRAYRAPAIGLSLERVKAILGPDCGLGEPELEQLRDQMDVLADVLIDAWEVSNRRPPARSAAAEPRKTG